MSDVPDPIATLQRILTLLERMYLLHDLDGLFGGTPEEIAEMRRTEAMQRGFLRDRVEEEIRGIARDFGLELVHLRDPKRPFEEPWGMPPDYDEYQREMEEVARDPKKWRDAMLVQLEDAKREQGEVRRTGRRTRPGPKRE